MNPSDHILPQRRSVRLQGFDYRARGAYFITICSHNRALMFSDHRVQSIIQAVWDEIPAHFGQVQLDEFVIMPNHVHGVLWIDRGGSGSPSGEAVPSPLHLEQAGAGQQDARQWGVERLGAGQHGAKRVTAQRLGAGQQSAQRLGEGQLPGTQCPDGVMRKRAVSAAGPASGSVGAIVGSFKSVSARQINELRGTPGGAVWQRNYYEHVIRDEERLSLIRRYIQENPAWWADDRYNPDTAQNRRVGK